MLRTAIAAVAAVIAIGLVGAPAANASCGLRGKYGGYRVTCLHEDHDQAVKDVRRVQRQEMAKKIAGDIKKKLHGAN